MPPVKPVRLEREHAQGVTAWAEIDAADNVTSGVTIGEKKITSAQLAKLTEAAADASRLANAIRSLV